MSKFKFTMKEQPTESESPKELTFDCYIDKDGDFNVDARDDSGLHQNIILIHRGSGRARIFDNVFGIEAAR